MRPTLDAKLGIAEERESLFNFSREKSNYTIAVDRKAGLRGMIVADTLTDIFFKTKWIVIECTDQHLITSDSPVVRITPREYHSPVYGDGGFLHKYAFVTLPLAPTKLMELGWIDGLMTPASIEPEKIERGSTIGSVPHSHIGTYIVADKTLAYWR